MLDDTTLVGGLPVTDSETTTFGVFLNDGTGSKMDFYQAVDTQVAWQSCAVDGRGEASGVAQLTVTLTNNAPASGSARLHHRWRHLRRRARFGKHRRVPLPAGGVRTHRGAN